MVRLGCPCAPKDKCQADQVGRIHNTTLGIAGVRFPLSPLSPASRFRKVGGEGLSALYHGIDDLDVAGVLDR